MNKDGQWKNKMHNVFNNVQEELKKTTDIGVRMFTASKTNSCLKDAYEELGKLVAREMKAERLEFNHARAKELLKTIQDCENHLSSIEEEVHDIKFKK